MEGKRRTLIETDYSFNYEAKEEGVPQNKLRNTGEPFFFFLMPPEIIVIFVFVRL